MYLKKYNSWKLNENQNINRNNIIIKLFKKFNLDIRIFERNNLDDPLLILDNKLALACYLKGYTINFTTGYVPTIRREDRTFAQIKLEKNINNIDLEGLNIGEWVNGVKHMEVFTIQGTNKDNVVEYFTGLSKKYSMFNQNKIQAYIFLNKDNALKNKKELENSQSDVINLKVI